MWFFLNITSNLLKELNTAVTSIKAAETLSLECHQFTFTRRSDKDELGCEMNRSFSEGKKSSSGKLMGKMSGEYRK